MPERGRNESHARGGGQRRGGMTVNTALIAKSLGISRKAALERAKKED
jgi:hypothetical protein